MQGLNTKKGFDVKVAAEISKITGLEFKTAPNKVRFEASSVISSLFADGLAIPAFCDGISSKRLRPTTHLLRPMVLLTSWLYPS